MTSPRPIAPCVCCWGVLPLFPRWLLCNSRFCCDDRLACSRWPFSRFDPERRPWTWCSAGRWIQILLPRVGWLRCRSPLVWRPGPSSTAGRSRAGVAESPAIEPVGPGSQAAGVATPATLVGPTTSSPCCGALGGRRASADAVCEMGSGRPWPLPSRPSFRSNPLAMVRVLPWSVMTMKRASACFSVRWISAP